MRVGIVGLGSIGRTIARNLHEGKIPKAVLAGATVRDRVKAEAFLQEIGSKAPILAIKELAANADIVVECAPPAVLAEIAGPILSAGKKLMVLSAGMLLRHPERFDCTSLQHTLGAGSFWAISAPINRVSTLDNPLRARWHVEEYARLDARIRRWHAALAPDWQREFTPLAKVLNKARAPRA